MRIHRHQVHAHGKDAHFAAEASDLGLRAGEWAYVVALLMDSGMVAHLYRTERETSPDGEFAGYWFVSRMHGIRLLIIND